METPRGPLNAIPIPESVNLQVIEACKEYLAAFLRKEVDFDGFCKLCLSVAPQRPQREMMLEKIGSAKGAIAHEHLKSSPDESYLGKVYAKLSYWEAALYTWDYWHEQEVKYGVSV